MQGGMLTAGLDVHHWQGVSHHPRTDGDAKSIASSLAVHDNESVVGEPAALEAVEGEVQAAKPDQLAMQAARHLTGTSAFSCCADEHKGEGEESGSDADGMEDIALNEVGGA